MQVYRKPRTTAEPGMARGRVADGGRNAKEWQEISPGRRVWTIRAIALIVVADQQMAPEQTSTRRVTHAGYRP